MEHVDKRGYLNKDYLLFRLSDRKSDEHTFHYHEFDKIVILLSGRASYIIEGREYYLEPLDVLLVSHHDIHMPVIDRSEDYRRIVIWINRDFITSHSDDDTDLSVCFKLTRERSMCLIKTDEDEKRSLSGLLSRTESAIRDSGFGSHLLADCSMLELLTFINRLVLRDSDIPAEVRYDVKIGDIIEYINKNLSANLSNDSLAHDFYISKSYLMHKFKSETGYTLHNYILQKRLLYSKELLLKKVPVTEAAALSGFTEYTTFLRAFRKQFDCLPSDFCRTFGANPKNV